MTFPSDLNEGLASDLEIEHDGREQGTDDEPSLGWTLDGRVTHSGFADCDGELTSPEYDMPPRPVALKGVRPGG